MFPIPAVMFPSILWIITITFYKIFLKGNDDISFQRYNATVSVATVDMLYDSNINVLV